MTPTVSIVIPCFNAERWLAECIESALGQTWPAREIIVVDDGSSDASPAVARSFSARGVRVIEQRNSGAAAARNTGLRASTGEWVQFLDADDLLAPTKVALQMERATGESRLLAWCCTWSRFTETIADADNTPQPLCRDADPVGWLVTKFEENRMMHPGAWLVPRELVERAGPWDESLSLDDDGEYFTRIVAASEGVRCRTEALSYYRSNIRGSLSRQHSRQAWESSLRSRESCAQSLLRLEKSPRTLHACASFFQQMAYDMYPEFPDIVRRCEAEAAHFGGTELPAPGGRLFRIVSRIAGWKAAKRLQRLRLHTPARQR